MFGLEPQLYSHIYYVLVSFLTIFVVGKYASYPQSRINQNVKASYIWVILLSVFLITFIGFRPVSDKYFVDIAKYANKILYTDYQSEEETLYKIANSINDDSKRKLVLKRK